MMRTQVIKDSRTQHESKTVITVVGTFDHDGYGVKDNPNSHQHLHSQMIMKTIEDLPNEIINEIFDYLDETDVIHMGLVYKRLARYKVQGDRIGSTILRVKWSHFYIYSNIIFALSFVYFSFLFL